MDVPKAVADEEPLHRRIHPTFRRPNGALSSQAFGDPSMSVDRAHYLEVEQTLEGYEECGVARLITFRARQLGQEVVSDKQLLNLAHALVKGKKTKAIARALARAASWSVPIGTGCRSQSEGKAR